VHKFIYFCEICKHKISHFSHFFAKNTKNSHFSTKMTHFEHFRISLVLFPNIFLCTDMHKKSEKTRIFRKNSPFSHFFRKNTHFSQNFVFFLKTHTYIHMLIIVKMQNHTNTKSEKTPSLFPKYLWQNRQNR
jgi:hypothetical protein